MDVRDRLRDPDLGDPPPPERAHAAYGRGRRRRRVRRAAAGAGTFAATVLVVALVWPQLTSTDAPTIDVADAPPAADDPSVDEPGPDEPGPPVDPSTPDPDLAGEGPDGEGPDDGTPDAPTGDGSAPPIDDAASTDDRVRAPDGPADLVVTDVRVGVHDGFDRVVVDLAGDGTVGWFTELGDVAFEDGSGAVVDVDGGAVLTLFLGAVAFPPELPDPGVRWDGGRVPAPADARVLTEVVDSVVFEGQHQLFVGLTERVPYRIARLSDPQRVVIDLLHP